LAAQNPSGRIVMPRTQISNVRYVPLISSLGRPVGIRVTYDVEFSQAGRHNPELSIYAEDKEDSSLGRYPLRPLKSTIHPVPREAYAPFKEAQEIPRLLAQRAEFLYEAGVTYTFALELVPRFVSFQPDSDTRCLVHEGSPYGVEAQKAFARLLMRTAPTTYRVNIADMAFQGRIDNFIGEGTFHAGFVAEGLSECERIPER
jgi:hypothetical protein